MIEPPISRYTQVIFSASDVPPRSDAAGAGGCARSSAARSGASSTDTIATTMTAPIAARRRDEWIVTRGIIANSALAAAGPRRYFRRVPLDYIHVDYPEPHAARGRQILAAHPELRSLVGPDPASAAWTALLVASQFGLALLVGG